MILATGAGGMTGSHLLDVFSEDELVRTDLHPRTGIRHLDICDLQQVMNTLGSVRPEQVIHLAAETDVDRCERDPDHAYRTNVIGTSNIAVACKHYEIELVYVSTCGVFGGSQTAPYTEFDQPSPINVYAHSKLEGERAVQTLHNTHYIVRAGWMFGGNNGTDKKFVGKIASMCQEGDSTTIIKAVNDKKGSPTYARDFLEAIKALAQTGCYGLYHVVNGGSVTRFDVAVEIAQFLQSKARVIPVSSDAFPLPAARPNSEAARSYKLDLLRINRMPNWRDALHNYLSMWLPAPAVLAQRVSA